MRLSQRQGLFGGLALLSCAAVALGIVLTRLCAALLGPPLAFLVASLPFFGAAAGGALLYVLPSIARPPRLFASLAHLACASSAFTAIAMIILVQPQWVEAVEAVALGRLAILYLAFSLPFTFLGAAFAAVIRHGALDASRLSFAGLAGAATGVLGATLALRVGAPRAGLIVAVVASAAAVVFRFARAPSPEVGHSPEERRPSGGIVATFALGSVVLLAGDIGAPWLKIPALRFMKLDKVELQRWSERALITVERPLSGVASMQFDGVASTAILEAKKTPEPHPVDLAYVLHKDRGPALVISPGGGVDVRRALKAGQKEVHAAEPDPTVVEEVLRGKYRAFSGELYDRPEVVALVADGRAYLRRSPVAFRSIVISLPDTWVASSIGSLSLSKSNLYTVDGFREILGRLTPEGTLVVSRWEVEFERLLSLSSAALRAGGALSPKDHLYACSLERVTSLLIKRSPLIKGEVASLRAFCKRSRFQEAFAPDIQRSDVRRRLATMPDARDAAPSHPTDLTAPTDDRPFFFYTVPDRMLVKAIAAPRQLLQDNQALLAVITLLGAGVVAALLSSVGPLLARPSSFLRAPARGTRALSLLFFMSLGAGAVLAGGALVELAVRSLGRPEIAWPDALGALLLAAAIGALLTGSIGTLSAVLAAGRRAQLLTALLAICAALAGPFSRWAAELPFSGRLAASIAMFAPIGLLMGSLFALGVKLVAARVPDLLAWGVSLCGVAGVLALATGTLLAVHLGFGALFLAGSLSYLIAAIAVPIEGIDSELGVPIAAPFIEIEQRADGERSALSRARSSEPGLASRLEASEGLPLAEQVNATEIRNEAEPSIEEAKLS